MFGRRDLFFCVGVVWDWIGEWSFGKGERDRNFDKLKPIDMVSKRDKRNSRKICSGSDSEEETILFLFVW